MGGDLEQHAAGWRPRHFLHLRSRKGSTAGADAACLLS